jgi:hypothetical protein
MHPFDLRLRLTGNSGVRCRFACGGCTEAGQSLTIKPSCGGSCAFQGCATMEPCGRAAAAVKEPTSVISDDDNDDSDVSGVLPKRRRRSLHECGSRPLCMVPEGSLELQWAIAVCAFAHSRIHAALDSPLLSDARCAEHRVMSCHTSARDLDARTVRDALLAGLSLGIHTKDDRSQVIVSNKREGRIMGKG